MVLNRLETAREQSQQKMWVCVELNSTWCKGGYGLVRGAFLASAVQFKHVPSLNWSTDWGIWIVECVWSCEVWMESKGRILHWSLNPLSLQGDWDVLGFEKILLQNLLGDIFLGRCIRSRLKKTWVLGGWGGLIPQTGLYRERIQRFSDRNIQRPCIQSTFDLTSSKRQCCKYNATDPSWMPKPMYKTGLTIC